MTTTLLIIDDSQTVREEVAQAISLRLPDARCLRAGDGLAGLKLALESPPDLILCDLEMPGMDGFTFLATKNNREELRDVPLILLTCHDRTEVKIRGLEAGASDYITKPFDQDELFARINIHLKIKRLQDELRRKNLLLQKLSNTDPLTGLYNRRLLIHALNREFDRSQRLGHCMSVVMIDLDHFKGINDTFGHQCGDQVLKAVANLLQQGLRGYDLLARYGGEEFCLLLPETHLDQAGRIAERFRKTLAGRRFDDISPGLAVTASFGVACFECDREERIEELLGRADEALYRAKAQGRNQVVASPAGERAVYCVTKRISS